MNTRSDSSIGRDGAGLSKGTYEALLSDGGCWADVSAAVMLRPGTGAGALAVLLDMVAVVGFCAVSGC